MTKITQYPNLFRARFIYSISDGRTPKTIEPFINPGHPSAATNPSAPAQDSGFVRVNWKMCDYLSTWTELVDIVLFGMFSSRVRPKPGFDRCNVGCGACWFFCVWFSVDFLTEYF